MRQAENLQRISLVSPTGQQAAFHVDIADDPEERSRGLMFREELPVGRGMLFVFDQSQHLNFWMKNTKMPLDILFFDEGGNFVSTATMVPCTADPCQTYSSAAEAKYALEVPVGPVEKYSIGSGWSLFPLPAARPDAVGRGEG